jgi:hypothetical protein
VLLPNRITDKTPPYPPHKSFHTGGICPGCRQLTGRSQAQVTQNSQSDIAATAANLQELNFCNCSIFRRLGTAERQKRRKTRFAFVFFVDVPLSEWRK